MAHSVLGEVECWCSSSSVRVARHTAQDARREASKLTRCKESKKKKRKKETPSTWDPAGATPTSVQRGAYYV